MNPYSDNTNSDLMKACLYLEENGSAEKKTQLVKQNESKNLNVNSESHLGCLLGELFCICNEFSTYLVFLLLPLNHFALPLGHLVFFCF